MSGHTWTLTACMCAAVAIMAVTAPQPALRVTFVAASLVAGVLCVLVWRRGDVSLALVIGFALLLRLALIYLPPTLSDDAYRYVWDGLLQAEGINPYLYTPDDAALAAYHDEPIYESLNSASYYSVYPPVSQYVFRIGAFFYEIDWRASYYVIKGILAALEFGAVLILARMLSPAALLLYAWNPLVLIAGPGQAHGEAALAFFFAFMLLEIRRGHGMRAAVWLACAGWVKLYPFVLFPLLWRRFGWPSVVAGITATALLALPFAHPSVPEHVWSSLDLYVRLFEFNAGPYYAIKEAFRWVTGADWSKQIGPALRLAYVLLLSGIYWIDWRRNWPLRTSMVLAVGAYFVMATTVHPWYLVGVLVLVAPAVRPAWHWHWLGVLSIGTYLLYVGGPYWVWVFLGWMGWAALAVHRFRSEILRLIMRMRARAKANLVRPFLGDARDILDFGAAEGFVAEALVQGSDFRAELIDVIDLNESRLPHRIYDGRTLPYRDDSFDAVISVYTMHHVENPEQSLQEVSRVARRRVVLVESTFRHAWQHRLLRFLDRAANRLRSGGRMSEESLQFRSVPEWLALFERLGLSVTHVEDLGGLIHHRVIFVLEPPKPGRGFA